MPLFKIEPKMTPQYCSECIKPIQPLWFGTGLKDIINRNLAIPLQVVNSTQVVLVHCVFDMKRDSEFPIFIKCKIPGFRGKKLHDESVPIGPSRLNLFCPHFNQGLTIDYYPLSLNFCKTIHKGQGATIPSVCVDMKHLKKRDKLIYVAFSRTGTLNGLFINSSVLLENFFDAYIKLQVLFEFHLSR